MKVGMQKQFRASFLVILFVMMLSAFNLIGCGGSGGGDSKNNGATNDNNTLLEAAADLTGTWNVVQKFTENCNDGESDEYRKVLCIKIEQSGNSLTLTDIFTKEKIEGTISGDTITWSQSLDGETSTYNIKASLSEDKNKISGSGEFTWTDVDYSCSERVAITATITGTLSKVASFNSDYYFGQNDEYYYLTETGEFATDGNFLWIVRYDIESNERILKMNTSGDVLGSIISPCQFGIQSLSFDGTYLWAVDSIGEIYKIDTDGNVITSFTTPHEIESLTARGTYLWGVGYPSIYNIDPNNGQVINSFNISGPESSLGFIKGLAFDGTFLWVAADVVYGNNDFVSVGEIHKFDTSGNLIKSYFPPGFEPPYIPPPTDDENSVGFTTINHISEMEYDGTYLWFIEWMSTSGEVVKASF